MKTEKTIRSLLDKHEHRQIPLVKTDASLEDLVQAIEWFRHSRVLYVVDEDNRLAGTITLGCIVKHVFHHRHDSQVSPRHVMSLMTGEKASDIMEKAITTASMDETVSAVLKRMIALGVEEIAVLDEEGRVTDDLTMIDLLKAAE